MSRVSSILSQLQDKLFSNYGKPIDTEGVLSGGPGFIDQYPPYTDDPQDDDIDVPNVPDSVYTTHRSFVLPVGTKRGNKLPFQTDENTIYEQSDKDEKVDAEDKAAMAAAAGEEAAEEATGESDEEVGTAGSETGAVQGMDAGLGMGLGMGMEPEEVKTAGQLGRIYELKKLYARLTSIESYLSNESSSELLEIRNYVSQAIELFEIISANFDSYKDKLDEIIIIYYKFILEIYNNVQDFYKKELKSGDI